MKITFGGVRGSYPVAANYCVWGHSPDQHTIEIAREANVGRLLLIHHHSDRSDADLEEIGRRHESEAFPVDIARESLKIILKGCS